MSQMKSWLEIIELRSTVGPTAEMEAVIADIHLQIKNDPDSPAIYYYNNLLFGGDFRIHLYHSAQPKLEGSKTGLQMASLLKEYGLVNHTLWSEKTFD
jgi:hypothetical protein